jgi:hypothetical protein
MERKQEQVMVGIEAKERGAKERAGREIEGATGFNEAQGAGLGLSEVRGKRGEVSDGQNERRVRRDELNRLAGDEREGGSQRFVSSPDFAQGMFERDIIKPSSDSESTGDVISGASRSELIQKPQSLLFE